MAQLAKYKVIYVDNGEECSEEVLCESAIDAAFIIGLVLGNNPNVAKKHVNEIGWGTSQTPALVDVRFMIT